MSLFEKLKLLYQLNKFMEENKVREKLQALLGKMDGLKSILGLLMILGYYIAPQFGVHVPDMVLNTGYGFLGVGLVHKLDKATDIIQKVMPVLSSILDVFNKKKAEETK